MSLDSEIDHNKAELSFEQMKSVIELCRKAGLKAVEMRAGVEISTKMSAEDLVTSADKAVSALLIEELTKLFPSDLVLSEEAPWQSADDGRRRWIVDPIDGTKYYVDGSGKYCVMAGLVVSGREVFGAFYIPAKDEGFFGGPGLGVYHLKDGLVQKLAKLQTMPTALPKQGKVRIMVSRNDLKANSWLENLEAVEIVLASSIGYDVFELHNGLADLFVHIRPTLGYWDTAASCAVAQELGFEVGTESDDFISYGYDNPTHLCQVIIGNAGALSYWRQLFKAEGR
ncbi:MAG: hypothetical protein K2Y32_11780 [Candidatus Obscuribacterales bacterium]|nr:hypothetical protein [Candidatus Obscuribacterales bacterium]